MSNQTLIALLAVYWLVMTIYIYMLLPKNGDNKHIALIFAIFTSPIIGPIKAIADCLRILSGDESITICRHNTGDKK